MNMNRRMLSHFLVFAAACIGMSEPRISAATPGDALRTSGVRCERRSDYAITREHERRLATSLRRITGFGALQFAADGELSVGDSSVAAGGSAEARRILMRAVSSSAGFVIEDRSGSGSVHFGQAASEQIYEPRDRTSSRVWRLRIDFDDFEQMEASSEVRAAFDEGFTFFHELLHGLGYKDPSGGRDLGECEGIVNRMRGELGLPLRDRYFGEAWRVTERLTSVRLRFRRPAPNGNSAGQELQYLCYLLTEPVQFSSDTRALTRVDKKPRR